MTLDEFLTENEKLCEAATKGPWHSVHEGHDRNANWALLHVIRARNGSEVCKLHEDRDWRIAVSHNRAASARMHNNQRFIIESRDVLPKVLKILRELSHNKYIDTIELEAVAERIINE